MKCARHCWACTRFLTASGGDPHSVAANTKVDTRSQDMHDGEAPSIFIAGGPLTMPSAGPRSTARSPSFSIGAIDRTTQLIDNLNASIHVRALLTDLFLADQALRQTT